jgi:hypothetical protein
VNFEGLIRMSKARRKPSPIWDRRMGLVENAIIRAALGWRHLETTEGAIPLTSEEIKPAWEDCINRWNNGRDKFNARFGRGCIRARIVRDGAMSCRFMSDANPRVDDNEQLWLTLARLDIIAEKHPDSETRETAQWMGDFLFMAMFPEGLIVKHAGGRDTIWHRRLRKQKEIAAKQRAMRLQELTDDQLQEQLRQERNKWAGVGGPPRDRPDKSFANPPVTSAAANEPPR